MKGFRRWMLNSLSGLSLLLFAATVGLWIRSYWMGDSFQYLRDRPSEATWVRWICTMRSCRRGIGLEYTRSTTADPTETQSFRDDPHPIFQCEPYPGSKYPFAWGPPPSPGIGRRLGFEWYSESNLPDWPGLMQKDLVFPDWMPAGLLAVLPLLWLRRYRRLMRYPDDHCSYCGYDLRATADRCPECGNIPAKKKAISI
jgi:hypothetical protein